MSLSALSPSHPDLVQETLLGEALEHAPVGAIVLDERGTYIAVNRLACELSGYDREELLAAGAAALTTDSERLPSVMEAMASGRLTAGIARMRRDRKSTRLNSSHAN